MPEHFLSEPCVYDLIFHKVYRIRYAQVLIQAFFVL
jgi:hypothetical protein